MDLSSSILFTLLYGDIFQYPYTADEIIEWLPKNNWAIKRIQKKLAYFQKTKKISHRESFYYLYGHGKNILFRKRREREAIHKWKKAVYAASVLRFIPTIILVGVTGGLALHNTDKDDDIDFYIGVKSKTVWATRFIAVILMEILGVRRRPGNTHVKDTICLNMFVSENTFAVPRQERDIYTAHEVLQMQPVWERGNAYSSFLEKNAWASRLFPSKWNEIKKNKETVRTHLPYSSRFDAMIPFIRSVEKPSKFIQLWYMRKRRTSEVISDAVIRFHPSDARIWIRELIEKKMRRFHLPLDKNFFQP